MSHLRKPVCRLLLVGMALAFTASSSALRGADPAADAARTRAEIDRKGRELKKKVADHRRQVEARQKEVQDRLKSGSPPVSATTNGGTASSTPNDLAKKELRLSTPSPDSKKPLFNLKKCSLAYAPKRGEKYAFQVEMSTELGAGTKEWRGTVYFEGIFSDTHGAAAEVLCIGRLPCRERSSPKARWSLQPDEDIDFPQHFRFMSSGVINADTASIFHPHTLPLQLSAILPLEELIFPDIPFFSNDTTHDHKGPAKYYLTHGQGFMAGMTDLNGESERLCRVEQENSPSPRLVNERSFVCADKQVSLVLKQVSSFDVPGGMVVNTDIDYRLKLEGESRLRATIRRLYGDELAAASAAALQKFPVKDRPDCFKRVPADSGAYEIGFIRSAKEVSAGQRVSVSLEVSERNAKGFRCYVARIVGTLRPDHISDRVRVRLDGSNEELDVSTISVRLPKAR